MALNPREFYFMVPTEVSEFRNHRPDFGVFVALSLFAESRRLAPCNCDSAVRPEQDPARFFEATNRLHNGDHLHLVVGRIRSRPTDFPEG